ncbi:MAG: hypothetical protein J6T74_07495 [Clostridia bacterium]|nr:hypothetical protein [Clostridia bacterium]
MAKTSVQDCYEYGYKNLSQGLDLPIVTLHSFRHANITLQLMAGVDMKTVSARAGHGKASTTTDIYSHFLHTSDVKAGNILDKIFE